VSDEPSISDDGRFVTFASDARRLDDRFPDDGNADVYLRDRRTGRTQQISQRNGVSGGVASPGTSSSAEISANGSVVQFSTLSDVLIKHRAQFDDPNVMLYDVAAGRLWQLPDVSVHGELDATGNTIAYLKPFRTDRGGGNLLYTISIDWRHQ
jgi:Tol biopolymer transport system component